jgi:hypothetical protein
MLKKLVLRLTLMYYLNMVSKHTWVQGLTKVWLTFDFFECIIKVMKMKERHVSFS